MTEGLRIYNLFPTLAGSIADWTAELPRIAAMGFNAVYLNPFHYPGFSGSLYAVKDYYKLNPRFRGNARRSDDDLLRGFTKAADGHGLRVIMDLVVNHTAKDNELTARRPQWFARDRRHPTPQPAICDPIFSDCAPIRLPGTGIEAAAYIPPRRIRYGSGKGFG